ncbi:response regulator [Pedobacter lithocola]|uniref:Response regulator n=1 Tax=Pedobacter lithocola TaxID=1908239 RepID=A0ABV8PAR2_9SPHI
MKTKILIIDDDELTLFLHKTLIQNSEYSLGAKYYLSAESALKYITKNISLNTAFLLLLDINMKNMDGWQLLDELKTIANEHNIYVVLVTSSTDEADKKRASSYKQVHGFLSKPLKLTDFKMLKRIKKL